MRVQRLFRSVIAALLALAILLGSCVCSASGFSCSVSGSSIDIYIRVFASTDPYSFWKGHYDMRINGTVKIGSRTFKNPCFSYGESSTMTIFSASDTSTVYKGYNYNHCREYMAHFTIKDKTKLKSFLNYLSTQVASVKPLSYCKRALRCTFKSSSRFAHYSASKVNCFTAVAWWLRKFGNSSLWKIYNNAYKYNRSYLPKAFIKRYMSKLKRVK